MAYKNKNKQKAHIASLQTKGWRKSEADRRAISKQYDDLRRLGLSTREAEVIINARQKKINNNSIYKYGDSKK